MRITAHSQMDQEGSVTELFGKVRDQAALVGLLNSLYELHLTLLSVEYISENKGGRYEKKISIRQSGRSAAVMA